MNTVEKVEPKPLHLSVIVVAILIVAVGFFIYDRGNNSQRVLGTLYSSETKTWDSQADFESGSIDSLDTTTNPGQVTLPGTINTYTEGFTSNSQYDPSASSQVNWDTVNHHIILNNNPASLTNYTSALTAAWGSSNSVLALAQAGNILYIAGSSGKFASINLTSGVVTDLSSTISGFWGGQNLQALAYDNEHSILYIGGSGGRFASFNGTTATDLTSTISAFWSSNTIRSLEYVPSLDTLYLGGDTARFAGFDGTIATSYYSLTTGLFNGGSVDSLAYNTNDNLLYLGGDDFFSNPKFAAFDGLTLTDLSANIAPIFTTYSVSSLHYSDFDHTIYLGGGQPVLVGFNGSTYSDYTSTLTSFWTGSTLRDISEDSANRRLFIVGDSCQFATFGQDNHLATNQTSVIQGTWGSYSIYSVAVIDTSGVIIGGPASQLARVNNGYASSGFGATRNVNATASNIKSATLTTTANIPASTSIQYSLSANGGTNWETVSPGSAYTFTNLGNDLRLRIDLSTSNSSVSPSVSNITLNYTTLAHTTGTLRLVFDAGRSVLYTGLTSASNVPIGTNISYRYRLANSTDTLNNAMWSDSYNTLPINFGSSDQYRALEIETILTSTDTINSPSLESISANYDIITEEKPVVTPIEPIIGEPTNPVTPNEPVINEPIIPDQLNVGTDGGNTIGQILAAAATNTVAALAKPIESLFGMIGISKEETPIAMSTIAVATGGASAIMAPISNMVATSSSLPQTLLTFWNNFLAFLGIGQRHKRGRWGRVVEQGTELPLGSTKIHLLEIIKSQSGQSISGRIIATTVSDQQGNFGFVAEPGLYQLHIDKPGYKIVKEENSYSQDQIFEIKSYRQGLVIPLIVMAMTSQEVTRKFNKILLWSKIEKVLKYITPIFLLFGTIVTINAMLQHYSGKQWILSLAYIVFWIYWFVTEFVVRRRSPWGSVTDVQNKNPLSLALVRVMDPTQKKLIRTAVTNNKGKYSVLVNKAQYSVITYKSGYQPSRPMKINTKDKLAVINQKIKLDKG